MKKITKLFMAVAFIVVLLSTMFVAAPTSAEINAFSYAAEPGDANAIVAYGTVVWDFAVAKTNVNTIYAATSDNALKSIDQGRTWNKIHVGPAGTDIGTTLVAVAPDDENIVAYVCSDNTVRISLNGGVSFFNLGVPKNQASANGTRFFDLDVSGPFTDLYGYTYRYVGVAGVDATGLGAAFYYSKVGAWTPSNWFDAVTDIAATGYTDNDASFFAVKFSPAFNVDSKVYLLSQNTAGNRVLELHVCSLNITDIGEWDGLVSGFNWYQNFIGTTGGTTVYDPGAVVANVTKGQIIFDPAYSGSAFNPYARVAYGCAATSNATQGLAFRIYENASAQPQLYSMVGVSIWSIALNDAADTLIMASSHTSTMYKLATAVPWFLQVPSANLPIKRIGGGPVVGFGGVTTPLDNQVVFFAGENLLASKAADMGAFSLCRNYTAASWTFNDISLVNSSISEIVDKVIKIDGTQRYVVTTGLSGVFNGATVATFTGDNVVGTGNHTSVYLWDGTYWERVFARADVNRYTIKASPVSFGVIYLGNLLSTNGTIYYTSTFGKDDWRFRQAPKVGTTIKDIEVVDDANLYVACDYAGAGIVCPLTYSGLYWNASDYIQVFGGVTIATITLVSAQEVLAGSTAGDVAYTSTGGTTPAEWTLIPAKVGAGNTYVEGTSTGPFSIIYAATDAGFTPNMVWFYVLNAGMSGWVPVTAANMTGAITLDLLIWPRVAGGDQCLYYLTNNATSYELDRCFLTDTLTIPSQWTWARQTGQAGRVPDALKGSAHPGFLGNLIWWIDTAPAAPFFNNYYNSQMHTWANWIYLTQRNAIYTDELAAVGPELLGPVDKYIVQVNKQTGIAYDTVLTWTHAVHGFVPILVNYYYQLQVALDKNFTALVINVTGNAAAPLTSPVIIGPWVPAITGLQIVYQPGEIYYWRVRAVAPFFSAWSNVRELDIQAAPIPVPELYNPVNAQVVNTLRPSFSWSPMSGTMTPDTDPDSGITTTYRLQLGTDPNFTATSLIKEFLITNTTGFVLPADPVYLIDGNIYYWRVCTQVTPMTNWSATFFFKVDLSAGTTTITETETSTAVPSTVAVPSGSATHTDNVVSPSYIWAIIIIGALLVIAIIVLIFRTRR